MGIEKNKDKSGFAMVRGWRLDSVRFGPGRGALGRSVPNTNVLVEPFRSNLSRARRMDAPTRRVEVRAPLPGKTPRPGRIY